MTAKPVWQTSMPALVKKQSNFFLTVLVCANAMETPCLHGDMSDPGTGGLFFFLWRGTDWEITSCVGTFQIWWITGFQSCTRTNLSAILLTAHRESINKQGTTNISTSWHDLLEWKEDFLICLQLHAATPFEAFSKKTEWLTICLYLRTIFTGPNTNYKCKCLINFYVCIFNIS